MFRHTAMSTKYPIKSGIFFNYRSYKNNKIVRKYTSPRKMAFFAKAVRVWDEERPEKMYLKVGYNPKHFNDGFFDSRRSFIAAYKAFTEQSLIDDISEML